MTFSSAPPWLQLVLIAEAAALGWLTYRFGWRGLVWGLLAGALSWFALAFGGTFLVARLEGAQPSGFGELAASSGAATVRLGAAAAPLLGLAGAAGGLLRARLRPRSRRSR